MKWNSQDTQQKDKINKILQAVDDFAATNDDFIGCMEEGMFYMWVDNYWKGIHEYAFERWLLDKHEPFQYMTKQGRKEAMHGLGLIRQVYLNTMNVTPLLDLENGMYDLATHKLIAHDKKYLSTIRLPYSYDKDAKCPVWLSFLSTSLEDNKERIGALQEFMGYCLGRDNSYHKALILIGEGRNGKGTTCHVIKNLVGNDNCTALKLGQITNENFAARLANKLVNIDADTDTSATRYESDFRRITGGDSIMVKNLYKDPFELTPYVRLVIGANDLPHISDKTHGLYDRLIIIPYNVSFFGKEDFGLKDKLLSELSGIFNWAIEGRQRLYERKRFSETDEMRELVMDLKKQNNPVEVYIDENVGYRKHDDIEITKADLYAHYKKWSTDNGYQPLSKIKFGKEFYRLSKPKTNKNSRRISTLDNAPIWPYVFLNNGKHSTQEQVTTWRD